MNRLKGAVLAAALAFAYVGVAAADEGTSFYAGVGLGQSTVENDDDFVDFDEDDTGFKVFGGYQINKFLAVELAYIDGGSPSESFTALISFDAGDGLVTIPAADVKNEVDIKQVNASAVGTYAFNDCFGVMGRLGVSYVDAEVRQTISALGRFEDDDNATEIAYGVGLWLAPTSNFVLRLEYEMTKAGLDEISDEDTDLGLLSLSAVYKFGK